MKSNEVNTVRFRASSAGKLMTNPRSKKAREAGELSQTAKSMIEMAYLQNQYGASEPIVTKEMLKGHMVEPDSVKLLDKVLPSAEYRKLYRGPRKKNAFFSGSCDIELSDTIEDIKSSWSLITFFKTRRNTIPETYYGQGQVYMDLYKKDKFRLCYTLVSTPEELLIREESRLRHMYNGEESKDYQEAIEQLWSIHKVDHIASEDRLKVFHFERDDEYLKELKYRVKHARDYYKTIKLNDTEPR